MQTCFEIFLSIFKSIQTMNRYIDMAYMYHFAIDTYSKWFGFYFKSYKKHIDAMFALLKIDMVLRRALLSVYNKHLTDILCAVAVHFML
jgi:hypothetical protein